VAHNHCACRSHRFRHSAASKHSAESETWYKTLTKSAVGSQSRCAVSARSISARLLLFSSESQVKFEEQVHGAAPHPRGGHAVVEVGGQIIICGGADRNISACEDVHVLKLGVQKPMLNVAHCSRVWTKGHRRSSYPAERSSQCKSSILQADSVYACNTLQPATSAGLHQMTRMQTRFEIRV
jgi:Kelch motif